MSEITYVCGCTQDENRELASDLVRTEVGHPEHEVWHDELFAAAFERGEGPDETGRWKCGCMEDGQEPRLQGDPRHQNHAEWHASHPPL